MEEWRSRGAQYTSKGFGELYILLLSFTYNVVGWGRTKGVFSREAFLIDMFLSSLYEPLGNVRKVKMFERVSGILTQ